MPTTLFEYFRKGMRRPAQDAWVISPSRGFAHMGGSVAKGYGSNYAAGVILPKQLLGATTAPNATDDILHLLRDNYEEPFVAPQLSRDEKHLQQVEELLKLSVSDFRQHAMTLSSADELSVFAARDGATGAEPDLDHVTRY